jgi:hypothetical protein
MDKIAAREYVRQMVTERLQPLIEAQMANAMGLKYLVTRDKRSGKFIRVTEAMAKARQGDSNEEIIEVWEKDPNIQAAADLLNRTLDKPKEQEFEVKVSGEVELVQRLTKARERAGS